MIRINLKMNLWEKLWSKVPEWMRESVNFIASLLTVVGIAYGAAKLVFQIMGSFLKSLNIDLSWGMCFFLVIIIMFMRFKLKQYKTNSWVRLNSISQDYYAVLHDYRNLYFDILSNHKSDTLNQKYLTQLTYSFLRDMLDKICDIFSAYTGSEINACIKLIGKENENVKFDSIDKNDATVYTFVRSSNISKEREDAANLSNDRAVLIKENTDFLYIIDPPEFYNKQYFYEQDLKQFDQFLREIGLKYQNTTPNYDKYYRAALVVPIRIAHKRLYFTQQNEIWDYHIIGFLCIDTLSTNAFIPEFEKQFVDIAKSFAAVAYVVMNKYMFYLQRYRTKQSKKRKYGNKPNSNKGKLHDGKNNIYF